MTGIVGLPPIRSWLFAPGNVPRFLDRVHSAGADAVVLDLEDSVPAADKAQARRLVAETLEARAGRSGPLTFVRVNAPGSVALEADLEAILRPGLDGIRVPKVEDPEAVIALDALLASIAPRAGLDAARLPLVLGIESARGVLAAGAIATASPRVLALAFGAADFAADVGSTEGPDRLETLTARSQLALASRAAGIRPPVDSTSTDLDDEAALERTTREGRDLGFFGRGAIHPRQVPVINRVYTPTAAELDRARSIVEAADAAATVGSGSLRLADGTFIDLAIVRRARLVLALADRLTTTDADRG